MGIPPWKLTCPVLGARSTAYVADSSSIGLRRGHLRGNRENLREDDAAPGSVAGVDLVLSLVAKGMTMRDVWFHLADVYGVEVSPELIPKSTDSAGRARRMAEPAVGRVRPGPLRRRPYGQGPRRVGSPRTPPYLGPSASTSRAASTSSGSGSATAARAPASGSACSPSSATVVSPTCSSPAATAHRPSGCPRGDLAAGGRADLRRAPDPGLEPIPQLEGPERYPASEALGVTAGTGSCRSSTTPSRSAGST